MLVHCDSTELSAVNIQCEQLLLKKQKHTTAYLKISLAILLECN